MSNDPMNGPPNRPRSTPIPDPDGAGGPLLPPPTAAQFLNQQPNVPWTPQPGQNVNSGFAVSTFGAPVATRGSSLGRTVALLILLISLGGVGLAIYLSSRAIDSAESRIPGLQPLSTFTPPTFTVPPITVTEIIHPVDPATTLPGAVPTTAAVLVIPTAPTVTDLATTLPTPPPATDPAPPPTQFPGGAATLYEGGATRAVADQLELGLAGEPTQLTVVYVFADYAVATAQDPAKPGSLIGAYWRDGSVSPADITSTGGGDLEPQLFTEGEVNWEAISGLVATAPVLLDLADGQVSYVAVQRVGTGNPPPIVIDVYVEGPSGSGYVEASASGDVLSVNHD